MKSKSIIRFRNPIKKRLEFVERQHALRPAVGEITTAIVSKALQKAPREIHPAQTIYWEKHIPWLGSQVSKLEKLKSQGRISQIAYQSEIKKLGHSFLDVVKAFERPKRKGVRQLELARLSPKQARLFAARAGKIRHEEKILQAKKAGYAKIKDLGNGYSAVIGLPNLKAPPFPIADLNAQRLWVEENAKFQQWLGVEMKNCLQFYKVNYMPYGASKYDIQRKGGKLYAILDPKNSPVAALLTDPKGQVIEENGPNNQPPPESAMPYIEKFEKLIGFAKGAKTRFVAPPGFDEKIGAVIERILDSRAFSEDLRLRRYFIRKAQGYARQAGADFSNVWPKFAIYILVESPYSALSSLRKIKYKKKREIAKIIIQVARLYQKGRTKEEFGAALEAAEAAAWPAREAAAWAAARTARVAEEAAVVAVAADAAAAEAVAAAVAAAAVAAAAAAEFASTGSIAAYKGYAKKLLELMREAAQRANINMQRLVERNPRKRREIRRPTRVRSSSKMILKCRKLWEAYCKKPGKKRLKAISDHLKMMKYSNSKRVKKEYKRCLKAVKSI
jgi:hypothetical protein